MEVILKVSLLLCFIILPLIPSRKRKQDAKTHNKKDHSEYGVSEDGYIIVIEEEEKKSKDSNAYKR